MWADDRKIAGGLIQLRGDRASRPLRGKKAIKAQHPATPGAYRSPNKCRQRSVSNLGVLRFDRLLTGSPLPSDDLGWSTGIRTLTLEFPFADHHACHIFYSRVLCG